MQRLFATGLLLALAPLALADSDALSTRAYDVRDLVPIMLLSDPPPLPSLQNSSPPTGYAQPDSWTQTPLTRRIIKAVEDGGGRVSLQGLSCQLLVTASPAQQARLDAMLAQIRHDHGPSVSVLIDSISVNPAMLALLSPETRACFSDAVGMPWPKILDESQVREVQQAALKAPGASDAGSPRVALIQNGSAKISAGTDVYYTNGYAPADDGREMSFKPVRGHCFSGLWANVRANAAQSVTSVDFQAGLSTLVSLDTQPWPGSPPPQRLTIQTPHLETHAVDQLLTIPKDCGALMWLASEAAGEDAFVLVTPTVIQRHE